MRGIDWRPIQLPLAAGVNQGTDDRALSPPELAAAIDIEFEETGGVQTRKPFVAIGSTIAGGGTISTARREYANGDEHVLFTKDSVYSWNDQLDRWVFRATHLAISSEEKTVYATPGDQYDCDRAELSGIVYHAWCDTDKVYVAATDKSSGAVILAPTAVGGVGTRPRLVALVSKVILLWHAGTDSAVGNLVFLGIDPTVTDPATLAAQLTSPSSTTLLAAASFGAYYDVTKIIGVDAVIVVARRATTTSYTIATIDGPSLTGSASTKARTCDGPIAVSSSPTGTMVQVIRGNGTNIQGDRITVNSLVDTADVGQAIGTVAGTPVSQITCAHRSVQDSGAYRCYAFWAAAESAAITTWTSKYNYVDTAGTIGTQANFVRLLGIGSRAFDYDGSVYVWGTFAGESGFTGSGPLGFRAQLQNTYFLYRDDATLHAKSAATRAGGLSPSVGRLPGVALTSGTTGFSWCGTERRIISIGSAGGQKGYDARAPRDITFTFDSNAARRCVRLGETLYVSGTEILQYDGVGLYELGFHVYPFYFAAIDNGTGSLATGTYTYRITWRWENAKGELDRSTTATHGDVTVTNSPTGGISIPNWPALYHTRKLTAKPVAVEVWRTAINPPEGAPFFLVTSKDPASLTNPNRYIPNAPTASGLATFNDEFSDETATTKEANPENGDVLENLAPPGATIIAANDTRVFLAGVAGDPDRVWYSKIREAGQVVSFHDALTFDVPRDGGDITGIAFQQGICVVFRERATYMFPGDGFDNTSRGQNYGPPQVVSYDVGCRDTDSITNTPEGIAFHGNKGKYLLTRGWTMKPIGLAVSDYDAEPVLAAHVVAGQHQVRWLTGSRMLVFDYLVEQWAEWTIASGLHATIWQGTYHYLLAAGPLAEQTTFTGTAYGQDLETAWIKPNDLQGAAAIRKLLALGEYRSACHVRTRIAYDYKTTWVDDRYWLAVPATIGLPLQMEIRPSRQKLEAIKLRLTVYGAATQATKVTTLDVPLITPTSTWSATLRAIALGTLGTGVTLSVGVSNGTAATVEVRDHQSFSSTTGLWTTLANNVGVKVVMNLTHPVTILAMETAINTYSDLVDVSVAHATPTAVLDYATIIGGTVSVAATAGGAFAAPTGESLKWTGLALEAGVTPRLHKRFPRT